MRSLVKKLELTVEERVEYRRTVTIETDLDEEELNYLLNQAEKEDHPEDFAAFLDGKGVKVIEYPDTDYNSPMSVDIECIDFLEVVE